MTNIVTLRNTGGFTRMDNSLMEALATVDLPAREFRILMAIARHTIGYQLESKRLSADEIGKLTNMRRDVVSKAISHLLERRVIFRIGGSRGEIGISPVAEWAFFEGKKHYLSETKTSHSAQIVSLRNDASETETATSLLYSKKEPLVTLPSEEITPPPSADGDLAEEPTAPVSFDGEDFHVDPDLIAKWAKTYAPVDVEAEIARAAAWASGSKPKKDWRRFLVNWLGREYKRSSNGADETCIPVDKIIDLYHRTCPSLAPVSVTTDRNLRARIVERWNESEAQQSSVFWKGFFLKANLRNEVFYGGERVKPRLEALVSRSVFRAIVEAEQ